MTICRKGCKVLRSTYVSHTVRLMSSSEALDTFIYQYILFSYLYGPQWTVYEPGLDYLQIR